MNREERPIVFTIKRSDFAIQITTKDPRGKIHNEFHISRSELLGEMVSISELLNYEGYAVLFEVD